MLPPAIVGNRIGVLLTDTPAQLPHLQPFPGIPITLCGTAPVGPVFRLLEDNYRYVNNADVLWWRISVMEPGLQEDGPAIHYR